MYMSHLRETIPERGNAGLSRAILGRKRNQSLKRWDKMPVQVTYTGVYVQEVPSGVSTVTDVSTSIAIFVGMTKRGRLTVFEN
jgi:hypothetical protein